MRFAVLADDVDSCRERIYGVSYFHAREGEGLCRSIWVNIRFNLLYPVENVYLYGVEQTPRFH